MAGELGDKSMDACEALYRQHQTFLSLPHSPALSAAFVAMVQDHYNNLKEEALAGVDDGAAVKQSSADPPVTANGHGSGPADHGSAEAKGTAEGAQQGAEAHDAEDEGNSNHQVGRGTLTGRPPHRAGRHDTLVSPLLTCHERHVLLQVHSQRSKRTPKPTAKVLASTPLSKRAAAGMSPRSASRIKVRSMVLPLFLWQGVTMRSAGLPWATFETLLSTLTAQGRVGFTALGMLSTLTVHAVLGAGCAVAGP